MTLETATPIMMVTQIVMRILKAPTRLGWLRVLKTVKMIQIIQTRTVKMTRTIIMVWRMMARTTGKEIFGNQPIKEFLETYIFDYTSQLFSRVRGNIKTNVQMMVMAYKMV